MHHLKLFFSPYIPPARGALLVAKALNLDVSLTEVDVFSDLVKPVVEVVKLNPQNTIPTLQDKEFVICDSHTIAAYLADKYAKTDELYPRDPKQRALVNHRLFLDAEKLFPRCFNIITPLLLGLETKIRASSCVQLYRTYDLLNLYLKQNEWLSGKHMTIADLCCISSLSTLDYFIPVSSKRQPLLYEYLERFNQLPYYEETNLLGVEKLGVRVQEAVLKAKNKRNNFVRYKYVFRNL